MPSWKTMGSGCLTILAMLVVAGGCVTSTVLFGNEVGQDVKPNSALIAFGITIIVGSLLLVGAYALSKDSEE
jgi:ABC-type Na+ efflux pump permease subunit